MIMKKLQNDPATLMKKLQNDPVTPFVRWQDSRKAIFVPVSIPNERISFRHIDLNHTPDRILILTMS